MKITRYSVNACCGTTTHIWKLSNPINLNLLKSLTNLGFKEHSNFTSAGIMFMDNSVLTVNGAIGSDKLTVKCKKADCAQILNDFEDLLTKLE